MNLLFPPLAFAILMVVFLVIMRGLKALAYKPVNPAKALNTSYACGENLPDHLIQPDYSQFFPFAFFFTILHVVALMVSTVPLSTPANFLMAVVYLVCAVVGLLVLYRR